MPRKDKKNKEKGVIFNQKDQIIDMQQEIPAEEEYDISFFDEANLAAKKIVTSLMEKVFYETACSLLRTCVYQKHAAELIDCQNIDHDHVDYNDEQKPMKKINLDVTDEDINNVYDGCRRLGSKWKRLLEECEQWDAALSIESILENGNFLELVSINNAPSIQLLNLDSKNPSFSGASHDLQSESVFQRSPNNSYRSSARITRSNESRKRNLRTTKGIAKVEHLSQVRYHDPCNLLFHKKLKTNAAKTSTSSKRAGTKSTWFPLPAMNTTIPLAKTNKNKSKSKSKSKERKNYIPQATLLPPSKIKKYYHGELYSRPSPNLTMFVAPNLGQSKSEDLSLDDRRESWTKAQISHIDQIAALCNANYTSIKKDVDAKFPFNTNVYGFNWFYGWDVIEKAVAEIPRKKRNYMQQVETRKSYEVIPKSLAAEDSEVSSNNTNNHMSNSSKKENAQNDAARNEKDLANQSETDLVIAKSRSLYLELADRRRRYEQQQQFQLEFEESAETNISLWKGETQSQLVINGRAPSTIGEEMYDINDIRSELAVETGEMSKEKLENEMIHKLPEEENDEDEHANIIQGALKEVGAIHMWEQSSTDINMDSNSLHEAKKVENLRKKYEKERLNMFANETTGITQNSAPNNAKKYKTKICRCTGINGKEYMNLDLGECMMECIDNDGIKKLLAFRSLEICLVEHDPEEYT